MLEPRRRRRLGPLYFSAHVTYSFSSPSPPFFSSIVRYRFKCWARVATAEEEDNPSPSSPPYSKLGFFCGKAGGTLLNCSPVKEKKGDCPNKSALKKQRRLLPVASARPLHSHTHNNNNPQVQEDTPFLLLLCAYRKEVGVVTLRKGFFYFVAK